MQISDWVEFMNTLFRIPEKWEESYFFKPAEREGVFYILNSINYYTADLQYIDRYLSITNHKHFLCSLLLWVFCVVDKCQAPGEGDDRPGYIPSSRTGTSCGISSPTSVSSGVGLTNFLFFFFLFFFSLGLSTCSFSFGRALSLSSS